MPISIGFHRNREYGTVGCTIGLAPHLYVGAYGEDKADSMTQAAKFAQGAKKTLDDNPELKAMMMSNPYGIAALAIIENSGEIMKQGGTANQVANAYGPAAASLMRAIFGR